MTAPAMLTVAEAAARLGISTCTAYRLIRTGDFPVPAVRVGRSLRVPAAVVDRLVTTGVTS